MQKKRSQNPLISKSFDGKGFAKIRVLTKGPTARRRGDHGEAARRRGDHGEAARRPEKGQKNFVNFFGKLPWMGGEATTARRRGDHGEAVRRRGGEAAIGQLGNKS